jgi:hypothetical protein
MGSGFIWLYSALGFGWFSTWRREPNGGVYRGRDEIDRIAGATKGTHPDFRYQPIAEPEELGNGGRVQWASGRPSEASAYAGTDFVITRGGQIAAVYLFFDKLP